MSQGIVTLDVREDLRHGREPFSKIMNTVAQLRSEEKLLLVAPFEPAPLFSVLDKQGFEHASKRLQSGDWEVLFTRKVGQASCLPAGHFCVRGTASLSPAGRQDACPTMIDVDARGLEPPQPMVKILEALAALPDGAELRAHTERKPMHLYAQLAERGFAGETEEQNDGSHITHIRRG